MHGFYSEQMAPIVRSPDGLGSGKAGVTMSTCSALMKTSHIRRRVSNGSMAGGSRFLFRSVSTAWMDMVGSFRSVSSYASGLAAGSAATPTSARLFALSLRKPGWRSCCHPTSRFQIPTTPAGAVHKMPTLTKNRTILIGDAGGFVSRSTGEGISPGMVSGAIAADVVHDALETGLSDVSAFNQRWRRELGTYLRSLPGGEQKSSTVSRIDLIFRSQLVTAVAGRIFLYGEPLSLRTFLKCL